MSAPPLSDFPLLMYSMVAVSASGPKTSSSADLVQSGIQPDSELASLDESLLTSPESLSEGLLFSYALKSTPACCAIDEEAKLGNAVVRMAIIQAM